MTKSNFKQISYDANLSMSSLLGLLCHRKTLSKWRHNFPFFHPPLPPLKIWLRQVRFSRLFSFPAPLATLLILSQFYVTIKKIKSLLYSLNNLSGNNKLYVLCGRHDGCHSRLPLCFLTFLAFRRIVDDASKAETALYVRPFWVSQVSGDHLCGFAPRPTQSRLQR